MRRNRSSGSRWAEGKRRVSRKWWKGERTVKVVGWGWVGVWVRCRFHLSFSAKKLWLALTGSRDCKLIFYNLYRSKALPQDLQGLSTLSKKGRGLLVSQIGSRYRLGWIEDEVTGGLHVGSDRLDKIKQPFKLPQHTKTFSLAAR